MASRFSARPAFLPEQRSTRARRSRPTTWENEGATVVPIARCCLRQRRERAAVVAISVDADVFVPEVGMFADERAEHLRAFVGVEVDDLDAAFPQPADAAFEVDRFA